MLDIPPTEQLEEVPLETACPVCRIDFVRGDVVQPLHCDHKFHIACIQRWLAGHLTCPMCRTEVGLRSTETQEDAGIDQISESRSENQSSTCLIS